MRPRAHTDRGRILCPETLERVTRSYCAECRYNRGVKVDGPTAEITCSYYYDTFTGRMHID